MKNNELLNKVTRKMYRIGFKVQKHSPEILMGAGIVGAVTSAVMACKATLKLDDVLAESKETVDKIHEVSENPDMIAEGKEYTEDDMKKDLTIVYAKAGLKVAKLYAPAIVLGGVSIVAIVSGHQILRKRNIALAAAYTAIDKGFKEYRGRVIDKFGEELDKELKYDDLILEEGDSFCVRVYDDSGKNVTVKESSDTLKVKSSIIVSKNRMVCICYP